MWSSVFADFLSTFFFTLPTIIFLSACLYCFPKIFFASVLVCILIYNEKTLAIFGCLFWQNMHISSHIRHFLYFNESTSAILPFLPLHSWLLVEVTPITRIMVPFFLINAELIFMMSLLIVLYKYSMYADSFNLLIFHTTKNEEINRKQQHTNAKRHHHII